MRDADVQQLLQDAIARPHIELQVEGLERHLHVLLVSQADSIADLAALTALIAEEVSAFVTDIDELTVWQQCRGDEASRRYQTLSFTDSLTEPSRPLGTNEQAAPLLSTAPSSEPPSPKIQSTAPIAATPGTRSLAEFCFVKNRLLLSAPLPPPHPEVARAVLVFHGWAIEAQLAIAPTLVEFFKHPDAALADRVPAEQRSWLYDLAEFRADRRTSVAAWLSRYCSAPDTVLRDLDRKLEQDAAKPGAASVRQPATELPSTRNRSTHPRAIAKDLNARLAPRGIKVELEVNEAELSIVTESKRSLAPHLTTALVYDALRRLYVPHLKTGKLSGLHRDRKTIWTREFKLPTAPADDTPVDRIGFNHPLTNAIAFPAALIVGMMLNTILPFVMFPFHIWIHEFGHATVAWLSGYRALPLPFGWTSIAGEKQVFVYLGVLFLLGLFIRQGWREQKRWPIAIGSALVVLQFYMTWVMSERQFLVWVSFSGIGGEFYLSAFLMACFYVRLPDRWRWDFWRFVVLVIAAATFCQAFWRWHLINLGVAQIPWGTIFGGSGDAGGDMNQLNWAYGWSSDRIISTYRRLGELCAFGLLGIYLFFAAKMNPHAWFDLQQRAILWWSDR